MSAAFFLHLTHAVLSVPLGDLSTGAVALLSSDNKTPMAELGAIVTPFIKRDVKTIVEQLESWSDASKMQQPCTSPMQKRTDWVFYYNFGKDSSVEDDIAAAFAKHPEVRKCFGNITFLYAGLSGDEDRYPFGPSNMWYRGMPLLSKYQYVFYMEADVRPIRGNWLPKIQEACGGAGVEPFWVKGSIVRGSAQPSHDFTGRYFHINGNAFYATGTTEFQTFVQRVRTWNVEKGTFDGAWDTEVARYVTDEENWEFARQNAARFHFTDLIQNYWQSSWSVKQMQKDYPWTYFVHGGMAQA